MTTPDGPPRRRRLGLASLLPLMALVTLLAWSFSSPVGSSPDEDFHLASIWCAGGDRAGLCQEAADADERVIPSDLVADSVCYAAKSADSGQCQGSDFGDNPDETITTDRGNFANLYPPVFYAVMSPLAGTDIEVSVLWMRALNSLVAVLVISALYVLLPVARRFTLLWSIVGSTVPLGLFLLGSINPSSWAILSAGTLWLSLLAYFETEGRRRIGLGAMAVVATVIGAGARADAAVYCGIAIVAVVILVARRGRSFAYGLILPAILGLIAIGFFLSARQSAAPATGLGLSPQDSASVSPVALGLVNLINVPDLWVGALGKWGLGWLDTTLPAVVWVASFGTFAGLVVWGLGRRFGRKGLAASWLIVCLFVIPTLLLVQSRASVGQAVQPRYILPLMVILLGIALLGRRNRPISLTRLQAGALTAALVVANSIALYTNLRRYVTGADVLDWNLDRGVEWWWSMWLSPMGVWALGTIAYAALLVGIALVTRRRTADADTLSHLETTIPRDAGDEPEPDTVPAVRDEAAR